MPEKDLDQLDLVFFRVKDFLDERRTTASHFFGPAATLSGLLAVGIAAEMVVRHSPPAYGMAALVTGWVLMIAWLAANRTFRTEIGTVSLKPKAAVTNFWGRNKDAVKILIIGTGLGTGGTLLVEWLKTFLQKR
jgi:hypothetical protein